MFLKNKIYLSLLVIICFNTIIAQVPTLEILEQGRKTSIRGMSVVNDNVVWVSGSSGNVGKSIDGGKTWNWLTVNGYEKSDFRDIEAFDENTALIMGITQPAVILKTKDGGLTWKKVFEDSAKAAFFDAMDFTIKDKDTAGILIGDPIVTDSLKGNFYCAFASNAGEVWQPIGSALQEVLPQLKKGEAYFASSGTNVKLFYEKFEKDILFDLSNHTTFCLIVSGGLNSTLYSIPPFKNSYPLNIIQGKESTGANSIAINANTFKGMIVGGDFSNDTSTVKNALVFKMNKLTNEILFYQPTTPPHGYRSCVTYIDTDNLITCGTSGVDISKDGGMNWELISKEGFHVVQKAKNGNAIFLAGKGGRIARFVYK
ncbi:MAG: YCF48-related protein [Sediminibacterium sp.]|nr:YCF48-related protein [Sediminibacterium sp.]